MTNFAQSVRERIAALTPDVAIETLEINQDGLINDVAIVNDALVFRFIKSPDFVPIHDAEMRLLDLVRPHVSLQVPTPIVRTHEAAVYPYLRGDPLTLSRLQGLDREAQVVSAETLGQFLHDLHSIDAGASEWEVPGTLAPVTREKWVDTRERVRAKVYPLMQKHQVAWAEALYDSVLTDPDTFDYPPAIIHGDLAPYHILFDPSSRRPTAVIDFGVAGMGDPALDFGSFIFVYGERFVQRMKVTYPGLDALLPRARFYAASIELSWVLQGIESGDPLWFAAHLGGARDTVW